ncbi:DUF2851 family protein [Daejeonella sp.]|uniref:DUF2851 family protein n=1 Tax=Daejeonella sp. TaxID=2805397 RepID=UPI0030BBEB80
MAVPEDFLHYLWKFRLFDQRNLHTISGDPIEIMNVGLHNTHAGPDFQSSLIRIGNTLWAGNVEIHLRSSDWTRHKHQIDPSYDSVILHVVGKHDQEIFRTDGSMIPVLALDKLMPKKITEAYLSLVECMDWIPCGRQISNVDSFHIRSWLYRVEIERLEQKSESIRGLLTEFKGGWDNAFYVYLAANFGFKTNSMPFEMLARSLPQHLLSRYKDKPKQIESLIFGQAGFLEHKHNDEYPRSLRKEYDFLKKKHGLKSMDNYIWKHMRMRPVNFPTTRLAQFAALVIRSNHLFSKILAEQHVTSIISMFQGLPVNEYWQNHYRFDKPTKSHSPGLGEQSVSNILINTVAVFLMAYGREGGSQDHIAKSITLLENLPAETNALTKRFKDLKVRPDNAFFSQSLIQLKKTYCDEKKCLSCGIGMKLLNL